AGHGRDLRPEAAADLQLRGQVCAESGRLLAPLSMGRPVRDRRQVLNGILWKLSSPPTSNWLIQWFPRPTVLGNNRTPTEMRPL
ncbi:hypothetical protein GTV15_19185, partial [Streptomyces sp. SID7803]|nr:hypothetical protein [Streptomyces sp. SID7803]